MKSAIYLFIIRAYTLIEGQIKFIELYKYMLIGKSETCYCVIYILLNLMGNVFAFEINFQII